MTTNWQGEHDIRSLWSELGGRMPTHPAFTPSWRGEVNFNLYDAILKQESIPRVPKHVLLYLVFRANESNTCFPSQSLIAKQLDYHRSTVVEAIDWLRKHGWIATVSRGRRFIYDLSPILTHLSPQATITCRPRRHRTSIELAIKNKSSEQLLDDFKNQVLRKCEDDSHGTMATALDIIIERAQRSGVNISSPAYLEAALNRFSFEDGPDREEVLQRRRRNVQ